MNDNGSRQAILNYNTKAKRSKVLFRVLPVTLYGPKRNIETFAMFDEGSLISMLDNEID